MSGPESPIGGKIVVAMALTLLWLFATWGVGSWFGWLATGVVDIAFILLINAAFPGAFRRQKEHP